MKIESVGMRPLLLTPM